MLSLFTGAGAEVTGEAKGSAREGERNQGVSCQVHRNDGREDKERVGIKFRKS